MSNPTSFDAAIDQMSRENRFRATVYAMNTLLVQKGIYSPEEFEFQFRQFAEKYRAVQSKEKGE